MSNNQSIITEETLNWVRSFIIEHNICPFAKGAVNKDRLRISVSNTTKKADSLEDLMSEIRLLDENPTIETTLLVYPDSFKDFFNYLDFIDLAEQLIVLQGYEGIYQIASFHPDYFFADTDPDDVSNYTNRSPYPMIHLLREDLLEKAILAYGDTTQIPEQNIAKMHQLGLKKIKSRD
ncbi:DUF1415 domain-containing protein [Legionella bononiensis]|uniref:DUF1415 domain-containing protein n=1 Tax=Legionella bononiensis TaxID=2793102 RepID=A0ABS1WAG4_9GAMM|nr:DUF1415 domain-containing protein [Legionella bononiensis]MBL7480434.1 DUF1415 domain-containing protein [Legionella bononiensis]MBL7526332.1 DUF1415 domain-containing protein [Legionella bononiensis]MBL7563174.1 DUF1415 domain-containing protein [Legionella bononiensis]